MTADARSMLGSAARDLGMVEPMDAPRRRGRGARLCGARGRQARRGGAAAACGADRPHDVARHLRGAGGAGQGREPRAHRATRPRSHGTTCCLASAAVTTALVSARAAILRRTLEWDTQNYPICCTARASARHRGTARVRRFAARRRRSKGLEYGRQDTAPDAEHQSRPADHRRARTTSFPVYEGTIGPDVIDIAKLYGEAGIFTYDPGFTSTASCESKITYIDGDEGILLYRGYPIEQLAENGDFLETCYLLLYGELPTTAQKADFDYRVTHHTMVHEQMSRFFQGFRRDAHPMAVMTGCVGALSAFYHDSTDISDPTQRMIASIRMIAKMPTIAAMAYKYSIGQPFIYPQNDLDFATNFLRMCFAVPCEEYKAEPGAGARHGPHLHPARRPRAERLDLDGAARRLLRRQSVRLHRGRHRLPVGPGAWRRQRGGAEDAGRDRHGRPHPGIHQARQGQERSASA